MRASDLVAEDKNVSLGPQLYVPRPVKTNEASLKPDAALWTSTAIKVKNGYTSDWVDWCYGEMPEWVSDEGTLMDVRPGARILVINTDSDAMMIARKYGVQIKDPAELFTKMPWQLLEKDYDAIHHNPEGMERWNNTFMSKWDVESTAWFNTYFLTNRKKVPISKSPVDEGIKNKLAVTSRENELDEYKVDNANGWGQTPNNENVDYLGLRVLMRPSTFFQLAAPIKHPNQKTINDIIDHLQNGGGLGAPFLIVKIPTQWEDRDFVQPARVTGHEGRHRMIAIQQLEGDAFVEVHIFFHDSQMRARHLTPEMIKEMQSGMMNQNRNKFIDGPLFLVQKG
jgi:hypothetical protein